MSQSAENLRREYFTVALLSGSEKVWRRGGVGGIKILRRKFIVSQCRRFSYGNPLLLHFVRVPKKIGEEGGSMKTLRRKFFVSQCRKSP